MNHSRRRYAFVLSVLGATLLFTPAHAQPVTTAVTGALTGPDRTSRLIAGARREGTLTLYSSTAVEDMTPLTSAFEKK